MGWSAGLLEARRGEEESDESAGARWEPSGQGLKDGYSLCQDTPSTLSLSLSLSLPHCFLQRASYQANSRSLG